MLIDFHTHAFPDKLAERALSTLAERAEIKPITDGTVAGLIKKMDEDGVDVSVICNIATNAHQNIKVNNFAIETIGKYNGRVIPLGSIHPEFQTPEEELIRLRDNGIKGIKLHPDYMGKMMDDPSYDSIFSLCAELDLFIITHAGYDFYSPNKIWATPDAILNRIRRSPETKFICAHFGGNELWDEVDEKLIGKNIWIDTSLGVLNGLPKEKAEKMLLKHDPDKILFASDNPWCSPRLTFEYVDSLRLSDGLKEKIYAGNAEVLLGL